MGSAVGRANVGGRVYAKFVSAAGVGNTAVTTDVALWTLTSIPAGTFASNGDTLLLRLGIKAGVTANNKQFGVTVGGTQVNSTTFTSNNIPLVCTVMITRVDATHVNVSLSGGAVGFGSSFNLAVASLATTALAVVVTGASPTTGAANDVVLYSGIAELK